MYLPIFSLPTLKPALLLRLYALCQERGMGMDEFVNGVVEQAVREAEERVLSHGSAARWEVQGELRLGLVAGVGDAFGGSAGDGAWTPPGAVPILYIQIIR